MPGEAPDKDSRRSALKGLVKAESMVQIAFAVPAGVCVGLGIGYLLDRHFHQHWIAILGIFLGAAGGFIQIFRVGLSSTKDDDK